MKNYTDMNAYQLRKQATLQNIANQSNKLAGVMASNLLCFYYGVCRDYPAVLPTPSTQQRNMQFNNNHTFLSASVFAYPSPANDWISLEYHIPAEKIGILSISDVMGKELAKWELKEEKGTKVWDTREIPNGVYFYSLSFGNEKVTNGKFVVTH